MYLASRLATFYELGGMLECLGKDNRLGSVTVCTAVSPPGGDFDIPSIYVAHSTSEKQVEFGCF